MNVLVVDIGGSHVKLLATGVAEPRRFDSGRDAGPAELVARALREAGEWRFDVVSIGYPGAVGGKGPTAEPGHLGTGWVGFDFAGAFGRPVRIVNDAALQALGAYGGGRMLFLGLGTGLGSALVTEHVVVPLELGCLWFRDGESFADRLGKAGLERLGREEWHRSLHAVIDVLRRAFAPDYIVLGGGNTELVDPLPEGTVRGGNDDAFTGGFRLWEETIEPHDRVPARTWRIVD